MEFNFSKYKRNPAKVQSKLYRKGETVYAKEDLRILLPDRYNNAKLATFGVTIDTILIFAIITDDGFYGVLNRPTRVAISPEEIEKVDIGGKIYNLIHIHKDSPVIMSETVITDANIVHNVLEEFYTRGNMPVFMDYDDVVDIFIYSQSYARSKLAPEITRFEILASLIARDQNDKTKEYRYTDMKKPPTYIGILDVFFAFDDTFSKVAGGYFRRGLATAIVKKSNKIPPSEEVLRK